MFYFFFIDPHWWVWFSVHYPSKAVSLQQIIIHVLQCKHDIHVHLFCLTSINLICSCFIHVQQHAPPQIAGAGHPCFDRSLLWLNLTFPKFYIIMPYYGEIYPLEDKIAGGSHFFMAENQIFGHFRPILNLFLVKFDRHFNLNSYTIWCNNWKLYYRYFCDLRYRFFFYVFMWTKWLVVAIFDSRNLFWFALLPPLVSKLSLFWWVYKPFMRYSRDQVWRLVWDLLWDIAG